MIEPLSGFPPDVLAFRCDGKVTGADYETVLIPAVEAALKTHTRLRLYYEIGSGFDGFEPSALFDDFKVGVEHLSLWSRIAVVCDVEWIRFAVSAFRFLMPGNVRSFHLNEADQARAWIAEA